MYKPCWLKNETCPGRDGYQDGSDKAHSYPICPSLLARYYKFTTMRFHTARNLTDSS